MSLKPETLLNVTLDDDRPAVCTWREFRRENHETLDLWRVEHDLLATGFHSCGGGASPRYRVSVKEAF